MHDDRAVQRMLRTRRTVIEQTAQETGWSTDLAEARGLSPMEQGTLRTVAAGGDINQTQQHVAGTLQLYGLISRDNGRFIVTDHGRHVIELID